MYNNSEMCPHMAYISLPMNGYWIGFAVGKRGYCPVPSRPSGSVGCQVGCMSALNELNTIFE
jgi:hypothetical protein